MSLIEKARKTAERRKRLYGIEPSPAVADLLAQDQAELKFRDAMQLRRYILFESPKRRLKLIWRHLTDRDTPARKRHIQHLAQELKPHLSESCRVTTNFFERRNFSRDLARVPAFMEKLLFRTTPSLVVQPRSEQDISQILTFCQSKKLAVFPRGSASFAFGGAVPTRNGIVMDLSPLMAILEVDPNNLSIRVQPGARWADLAAKLETYDLAPITTPTSHFSTVAGWISTGGMGLNSYAYGSIFDSVLAARVVRPDGTIEELDKQNDSIQEFFGTEGQFGILTEITLRVLPKPGFSRPSMLTFENSGQALAAIEQITNSDIQPSHVVFFDSAYMQKENVLFQEHTGLKDPMFSELDSVLLHFETAEEEQKFLSALNGKESQVSDNKVPAQYLWADRYFPLKAQRLSPGLLGAEMVVPQAKVSKYISKVRKLARHFKIDPTIEVIVGKEDESYSNLVIASFNCDYSKSLHYVLSLLFIQLLVRMAVHFGGHPYGIGIWNTPFVKSKYDPDHLNRLKQRKLEIDPNEILNPNKFFKIKGRFFSIPALALRPFIFRMILGIAQFCAPVLGLLARIISPKQATPWEVPDKEDESGKSLLHQSAQRCTSCGSCLSVCPAYHITQDELVVGRTKLRMSEAITNGIKIKPSEAHSPFQCLHCGLCEEVCQTRLPLRECYLALEGWLEDRFGSPADTVAAFVEKLDDNREFLKEVFGLDLPDWTPEEAMSRVPVVERNVQGGEN